MLYNHEFENGKPDIVAIEEEILQIQAQLTARNVNRYDRLSWVVKPLKSPIIVRTLGTGIKLL